MCLLAMTGWRSVFEHACHRIVDQPDRMAGFDAWYVAQSPGQHIEHDQDGADLGRYFSGGHAGDGVPDRRMIPVSILHNIDYHSFTCGDPE